MTNALDQTTTYDYDNQGRQIAMTDFLGRKSESIYNERGEMVMSIAPDLTPNDSNDNPRMQSRYDDAGRKVADIDQLGRESRYVYDKVGRMIESIHPDLTPNDWTDNARTKTEYYTDGLVKASIDELGYRTEFRYDELGRQIAVIAADATPNDLTDNPTSRYVYDKSGQQTTMTDALGHTTSYEYDKLGRMSKTIFDDKTFVTQEYDNLGRRVAAIDQNGKRTEYRYDDLGRLTGVKDALQHWTEYGYNELGQMVSMTDAETHTTRYEYDQLGRRSATILPLTQRSSMTYDAVGNLKTTTDFNGKIIIFNYDEQNRLTEKLFQDGSKVVYAYTRNNLQDTVTFRDSAGLVTSFYDYDYDVRDRLVKRTDSINGMARSIEYGYDIASNRTSVTTASGTTTYTYDDLNRLDLVKLNGALQADYDYDAANRLTKTTFGNGTEEIRDYDTLNRLTILTDKRGATELAKYVYTLDKVGNRKVVTETVDGKTRSIAYTYDDLYRLTDEAIVDTTNGDSASSYTYDNVGNRLTKTVNGVTTTYEYDGNDRLQNEKVGANITVTYNYDNNGNTIWKDENGVITTYVWNDEKRLVSATIGTTQVEYGYNDQGIRVSSKQNGVETRYLLDEGIVANVWEEYAPNGAVQAAYVYGNDLITQTQAGQTSYYLVDGLGSTRLLTDTQGQVLNAYGYEAFGETVRQSGTTSNKYQYAGEQFDAALGDYYLRQRFYDSSTRRFGRMDTWEGQREHPTSLNRYAYANSNPVAYTDPSGYIRVPSDIIQGNQIHNLIGLHFIGEVGIPWTYPLNPMNNGMFTVPRVFDPRFPLNWVNAIFTGSRNRPTNRRIIRTSLQNPNHPGIPGMNGQSSDLVDFPNEEFYEIKPNSRKPVADAQNKLQNTETRFRSVSGLNQWSRGTSYNPPIYLVLPNSNIVNVRYHSPGLLVYDIYNVRLAILALVLAAKAIESGITALIIAMNAGGPARRLGF